MPTRVLGGTGETDPVLGRRIRDQPDLVHPRDTYPMKARGKSGVARRIMAVSRNMSNCNEARSPAQPHDLMLDAK